MDQASADLGKLRISLLHRVRRARGFGLSTYCFQVCGQVRERGSRNPCMQANLFDFERAVRWLGEETYADSSLYRCINTSRIWGPCPRTFEADGEDCYESDYLVQSRLLRRQDYWKRQEERESAERQRAVRAWSHLPFRIEGKQRRKWMHHGKTACLEQRRKFTLVDEVCRLEERHRFLYQWRERLKP